MLSKKTIFLFAFTALLFLFFQKIAFAGCTQELTREYKTYYNNVFFGTLPLLLSVYYGVNLLVTYGLVKYYHLTHKEGKLFVHSLVVVLVTLIGYSLLFFPYISEPGALLHPGLFPLASKPLLIPSTSSLFLINRFIPLENSPMFGQLILIFNPLLILVLILIFFASYFSLKKVLKITGRSIRIAIVNTLLLHPFIVLTIFFCLAFLVIKFLPFEGAKYTGMCF